MFKINGMEALSSIRQRISYDLEEMLRKEVKPAIPLREIVFKSFSSISPREDDSALLSRCQKLDPKARKRILELIYQRLLTYDLKTRSVDSVLSQYYINYYGNPSDISSSTQKDWLK